MLFQAVEVEYLKSDLVPMFVNLVQGRIVQGLTIPSCFYRLWRWSTSSRTLVPMFASLAEGRIVQGLIVPHSFSGCGGGVPQVGPGPDVCEPYSGTNRSGHIVSSMLFQAVEVEYLKSDLVPIFVNLTQDKSFRDLSYPHAFSGCGGGVPQF
jgi:hypothetical protein